MTFLQEYKATIMPDSVGGGLLHNTLIMLEINVLK
jgi:hypothetical protein